MATPIRPLPVQFTGKQQEAIDNYCYSRRAERFGKSDLVREGLRLLFSAYGESFPEHAFRKGKRVQLNTRYDGKRPTLVNLTLDQHDAIGKMCKRLSKSKAEVARMGVQMYFVAHGQRFPEYRFRPGGHGTGRGLLNLLGARKRLENGESPESILKSFRLTDDEGNPCFKEDAPRKYEYRLQERRLKGIKRVQEIADAVDA